MGTQRQTALSELRKSQTFGRGAPKDDDSLLSATDATPSTNADSAPPASAIASALGSGKLPQYDVLQRRPVGASGLLSEKEAVQEDERSQAAQFLWIMYLGRQPEGSDEKTALRISSRKMDTRLAKRMKSRIRS